MPIPVPPEVTLYATPDEFPIDVPFDIHIDKAKMVAGVRKNCYKCPAALALKQMLPDGANVAVTTTVAGVKYQGKTWQFQFPLDLQQWIVLYDSNYTELKVINRREITATITPACFFQRPFDPNDLDLE